VNVVGLFAGIGGIELGFQKAGAATSLLVEIEKCAQGTLSQRFPEVRLHSDVKELKSLPAKTNILTAGFPCQDISSAGRTVGIGGENSGLVREIFRLIKKSTPEWVLFENVPFILNLHQGAGIRTIVKELESSGYKWAYRVIDSRAFGLPQRRRRLFILASKTLDPGPVLFRSSVSPSIPASSDTPPCGFYWTEGNTGLGLVSGVIPTLKGGSSLGIPSAPAIWWHDRQFYTPDIRDAERFQGFKANWTKNVVTDLTPRRRWKLVGNAVPPVVAKWIATDILKPCKSDYETEDLGKTWPIAAEGQKGKWKKVLVSEWPVRMDIPKLKDFFEYDLHPLSLRAASGFHSRLIKSGLNYPDTFAEDLARYILKHSP
jgi:DNA (cytosine-5)-methyltransferase 1